MQRECVYHSYEWSSLVEQGWTTWTVDWENGLPIALMVKLVENTER